MLKFPRSVRVPFWKIAVLIGTVLFCLTFIHSNLEKSKTVFIPEGASLSQIASTLKKKDIIYSETLFKVLAYATGSQKQLKAGEYFFPVYVSLFRVQNILISGKTISYRITIPEGLTVQQIREIVDADDRLTGKITVKMHEGYLLPDTYFFRKNTPKNAIIQQMKNALDKTLDDAWKNRSENLPYRTKYDALIMASVIEKETSIAAEREVVASVFVNRLNKNMRLQTDPTVVYAITKGYGHMRGRRLLRRHLFTKSAYNTYRKKGLPPTPIANPGAAAIHAALHPAKTDYIYFVADGTGGHVFAKTLEEHNQNAREWRDFRKQKEIESKKVREEETALSESKDKNNNN